MSQNVMCHSYPLQVEEVVVHQKHHQCSKRNNLTEGRWQPLYFKCALEPSKPPCFTVKALLKKKNKKTKC